jgi:predicted hotdog family 3-hydroxylacyl-ACP dehydratase
MAKQDLTPLDPSGVLPHTGSAVLIDAIVDAGDGEITAIATITARHPYLVAGHGVPAWVGIELMAQTAAAHSGLIAQRSGGTLRRGMLLGTRHYQAQVAWFAEGTRLVIHAAREFGDTGAMAACRCRIEADGATLAEATLIIYEEASA